MVEKEPKKLPIILLGQDFHPLPEGRIERYQGGAELVSPEFYLEGIGEVQVLLETQLELEELTSGGVEYRAKILRKSGLGENEFVFEEVEELYELWPSIKYASLDRSYPNLRCVLTIGNMQLSSDDELLNEADDELLNELLNGESTTDVGELGYARFGNWKTTTGECILLYVPTSLLKYVQIRFEQIPLE